MADYLQGRTTHVDKHLSNVAINYRPPRGIWDKIFPIIPVAKQSDMLLTFTQGDLFRIPSTLRARGTEAQKVGWQVSSDTYYCENYALKYAQFDEDAANQDDIFASLNDDEARVMKLKDFLGQDAELRIANQVTSTSNVGSSVAVASSWTSPTVARPVDDLFTAIRNVEGATGYRPNRVLFSSLAWDHWSANNQVVDKVFGTGVTGGGMRATAELTKQLLQMDEVLIGGAFQNTAEEGIAQTLSRIWADHVLVYYAPATPSRFEPSFGYEFRWQVPGIPNFNVLRLPHDDKLHLSEVEVGYYQDERITASALGFLVTNVTSSQ